MLLGNYHNRCLVTYFLRLVLPYNNTAGFYCVSLNCARHSMTLQCMRPRVKAG
jgi:hypothetical protein